MYLTTAMFMSFTELFVMLSLLHFANNKSNSASTVFLLNLSNAGLRGPSARVSSTYCGGLMSKLCTLTVSCTSNSGRFCSNDNVANFRLCLCFIVFLVVWMMYLLLKTIDGM